MSRNPARSRKRRLPGPTYLDYHYTPADTLDKVNPKHLTLNTATMVWVLAEMPGRLGE